MMSKTDEIGSGELLLQSFSADVLYVKGGRMEEGGWMDT